MGARFLSPGLEARGCALSFSPGNRESFVMLEENRKDLDAEKQKKTLLRLIEVLSASDPDLYYRPTSDIAAYLEKYIRKNARLTAEERALMERLSRRDLEVLLSLH